MEQSAVEWFFNELERMQYFIGNDMLEAYKQAKQLEMRQIIDAYKRESVYMKSAGCTDEQIDKSAVKYYNETFKK